jgi:hypothetical protein
VKEERAQNVTKVETTQESVWRPVKVVFLHKPALPVLGIGLACFSVQTGLAGFRNRLSLFFCTAAQEEREKRQISLKSTWIESKICTELS